MAKQAEKSDEGMENIIAIAVVALLAIGVGWWVYSQATATPAQAQEQRVQIPLGGSPTLGNDSAPMTVVEFSDFECPYCGQFERESFAQVKKDYIDTGKVKFVFKQFPLPTHKYAGQAATAAYCANEQGKFWEYHDVLFHNQEHLELTDLQKYATDLGFDMAEFGSCMQAAGPNVEAERALGEQLGVTGTPTFFFNGRKVVGAISPQDFGSNIAQG